jgi:hypothetical protein
MILLHWLVSDQFNYITPPARSWIINVTDQLYSVNINLTRPDNGRVC